MIVETSAILDTISLNVEGKTTDGGYTTKQPVSQQVVDIYDLFNTIPLIVYHAGALNIDFRNTKNINDKPLSGFDSRSESDDSSDNLDIYTATP